MNLSSHANVRSTRSRNRWIAGLNNRLRPRLVVLRLRGFSLMFGMKWLQVLGPAEMTHVDQRVGHQFHAVVALLDMLEPQQQPLEFILPSKRPLDPIP